jgi:ABC-type sugar transport system ATPase subunit
MLSNLDAKPRVAMRAGIKGLHQTVKTTSIYVADDQIEAMTPADRLLVLNKSVIERQGTPF